MKVFRDLEFQGKKESLSELVTEIERNLSNGWIRDREKEKRTASLISEDAYNFTCTKLEDREAALLALFAKDDNTLYVANIVPTEKHQLTHEQYNKILVDFFDNYAKPAADHLGIRYELTKDTKDLSDWLSKETQQKLQSFSAAANKSTGSSHPADKQRWLNFLVAAHRENTAFDSHTLVRWLTESEGWPDSEAHELAIEYEFARDLLKVYDEQ